MGWNCARLKCWVATPATTMAPTSGSTLARNAPDRLLMAAWAAWHPGAPPALAATRGVPAPAKTPPEFAPRKAYRECLNRNFTPRLTREA
jgi:hypothetical protein